MSFKKSFNEWLCEKKLSRKEIAKVLGINPRVITSYLSGYLEPGFEEMNKLKEIGFDKKYQPIVTSKELYRFLEDNDLTQNEFAELSQLSVSGISNFLLGHCNRQVDVMRQIRKTMNELVVKKQKPKSSITPVDLNMVVIPEEIVPVKETLPVEVVPVEETKVEELVTEVVKEAVVSEPITFRQLFEFLDKYNVLDATIKVGGKIVVGKSLEIVDVPVINLKTE